MKSAKPCLFSLNYNTSLITAVGTFKGALELATSTLILSKSSYNYICADALPQLFVQFSLK